MEKNSFILRIEIPDDLVHQAIFKLPEIPCVCKVDGGKFHIEFRSPLPLLQGELEGWDHEHLQHRAPAMGGSTVTYYCPAKISVANNKSGQLIVKNLSFFILAHPGWFPVIDNFEWAMPVDRNTPESIKFLQDFEASLGPTRSKRKRK